MGRRFCDANWSIENANVVCRQLRYPGALTSFSEKRRTNTTGAQFYIKLNCSGNEDLVSSCPMVEEKSDGCNEVSVICRQRKCQSALAKKDGGGKGQLYGILIKVSHFSCERINFDNRAARNKIVVIRVTNKYLFLVY